MDARKVLKCGLQVVATLLAAFHGFLLKISPPDEIQQWQSAYSGYASFIILIVFLGIASQARKSVASSAYLVKCLRLAIVCASLSVVFFFTYQERTHKLTYLFPPGAQFQDLHVKGTVFTKAAEQWRSDHPTMIDAEVVSSFGGPKFAERVWTPESIEHARIELTGCYVALVVTLLSAVLLLLEGALEQRHPVGTTEGKPAHGASAQTGKGEDDPTGRAEVGAKRHVFVSYCRENKNEVAQLRDELMAGGEAVWWDQDIKAGQDWKLEIRKAMKGAYAVVLCLSQESEARTTSGIYPEALDAIAAYREYAPGSIFLIPVRLSKCEIPPIEIDGTRMLDRLQFVDLFPAHKRANGLKSLLDAIRSTPHRPRPVYSEPSGATPMKPELSASTQPKVTASESASCESGGTAAERIADHNIGSHQSQDVGPNLLRTRSKPSSTIESGLEGHSLVLKWRSEFSVLRYKVSTSSGAVVYDAPNRESWVTSTGFRWTIPASILAELWNDGGGLRSHLVSATILCEVSMDGEEIELKIPILLLPDDAHTESESKFVVKSTG